MFKRCEKCDKPMGAAVGRVCDRCRAPIDKPVPDEVKLRSDVAYVKVKRKFARDIKRDAERGEPCPTCGKPVGVSSKERQRRYRERKKERADV